MRAGSCRWETSDGNAAHRDGAKAFTDVTDLSGSVMPGCGGARKTPTRGAA
jgi:hypothetical protein